MILKNLVECRFERVCVCVWLDVHLLVILANAKNFYLLKDVEFLDSNNDGWTS